MVQRIRVCFRSSTMTTASLSPHQDSEREDSEVAAAAEREKEVQVARKICFLRALRIGVLQQQQNQLRHQHQLLQDRCSPEITALAWSHTSQVCGLSNISDFERCTLTLFVRSGEQERVSLRSHSANLIFSRLCTNSFLACQTSGI